MRENNERRCQQTASRASTGLKIFPSDVPTRERKIKYFGELCANISELNAPILGSEKHLRIKRGFNFRTRAFIRYSQYGSSASVIAIDINIAADRNMHLPSENRSVTCERRLKSMFYPLSLTIAVDIFASHF